MADKALTLPTSADPSGWTADEYALIEAAGLVSRNARTGVTTLADRATVAAFLVQCQRSGLDPLARQIYCIRRGSKWTTQVSIDGMRLIAERTGEYEGQTLTQWSDDGRIWVDAWLPSEGNVYPMFARVGVWRRNFREALYATARWDSYAVYNDEWQNGQKTGRRVLTETWEKMPDLMLAKVAEALALRRAFPQDLSGLYESSEMQQADQARTALVQVQAQPRGKDWLAMAKACTSLPALRLLRAEGIKSGEWTEALEESVVALSKALADDGTPEPTPEPSEAASVTPTPANGDDWDTPPVDAEVVDAEIIDEDMIVGRFAKLKDGEGWGIKLQKDAGKPVVGDTVLVEKKDGSTEPVILTGVDSSDRWGMVWTFERIGGEK
jgi:phage recombination protein Bet